MLYFFSFYRSKTGHYLANRLKAEYITNLYNIREEERIENIEDIENSVLIRFGREDYPSIDNSFSEVLNRANSIRRVLNKGRCLQYLRDNEIRTPEIFFRREDVDIFPVMGRKKAYHSHGKWIRRIPNRRALRRAGYRDHYTEFIRGTELRVHVIGNTIVRLSKKIPRENGYHKFIRSGSRGWRFIDLDQELNWIRIDMDDLKKQCVNAMKILELDFGAIDVILENSSYLPYILEVNTAPSLNRHGRRLYEQELRNMLELPQRRWNRELEFTLIPEGIK